MRAFSTFSANTSTLNPAGTTNAPSGRGALTGEGRQAGGKHTGAESNDKRPCGYVHGLFRPTWFADTLVDPLQDEIGDLQVVLVLHDHVAVAVDSALRRAEHLRLTAGRLEASD